MRGREITRRFEALVVDIMRIAIGTVLGAVLGAVLGTVLGTVLGAVL